MLSLTAVTIPQNTKIDLSGPFMVCITSYFLLGRQMNFHPMAGLCESTVAAAYSFEMVLILYTLHNRKLGLTCCCFIRLSTLSWTGVRTKGGSCAYNLFFMVRV